jgi:hypothetical protein
MVHIDNTGAQSPRPRPERDPAPQAAVASPPYRYGIALDAVTLPGVDGAVDLTVTLTFANGDQVPDPGRIAAALRQAADALDA